MNDNYIITSKVNELNTTFFNEKNYFENNKNQIYNNYLFNCSDNAIQSMSNNIRNIMENISSAYENIGNWFNDYVSDSSKIEEALINGVVNVKDENTSAILNTFVSNFKIDTNKENPFKDLAQFGFESMASALGYVNYDNFQYVDGNGNLVDSSKYNNINIATAMKDAALSGNDADFKSILSYEEQKITYEKIYKLVGKGNMENFYSSETGKYYIYYLSSKNIIDSQVKLIKDDFDLSEIIREKNEFYKHSSGDGYSGTNSIDQMPIYMEKLNQLEMYSLLKQQIDEEINFLPYTYLYELEGDEINNFDVNIDSYNKEQITSYEELVSSDKLDLEEKDFDKFDMLSIGEYLYNQGKRSDEYIDDDALIDKSLTGGYLNVNNTAQSQVKDKYENNCVLYYSYMTEDEKYLYQYLFSTKGKNSADDYLETINDKINQRIGYKLALDDYNKLKLEGNIKINSDGTKEGYAVDGEVPEVSTSVGNYVKVSGRGFADGWNGFFEGFEHLFSDDTSISADEYRKMYYTQLLSDNSLLYDEVYEFHSSMGNMAPSIITSVAITFVATPAAGELAAEEFTVARKAAQEAGKKVGASLMGLSAAGNNYHMARTQGAGMFESSLYGIITGGSEMGLEYFFGGILGKDAASGAEITFKNLTKDIMSEGAEEYVQEWFDAGCQYYILGNDFDIDQVSADARKSFIMGALMAGTMQGGSASLNIVMGGIKYNVSPNKIFEYMLKNPDMPIEQAIENACLDKMDNNSTINQNNILNNNITDKAKIKDVVKNIMSDNSGKINFSEIINAFKKNNKTEIYESNNSSQNTNGALYTKEEVEYKFNRYNELMNIIENTPSYKTIMEQIKNGNAVDYTNNTELIKIRQELSLLERDLKNAEKYGYKNEINNNLDKKTSETTNIEYKINDIAKKLESKGWTEEQIVLYINQMSESDINNFDINKILSQNGLGTTLKQEIANSVNPKWDTISKIRKVYLELNKRLQYDMSYLLSSNPSNPIIYDYNSNIRFENMTDYKVLCNGWSNLFAESLTAIGINPMDITIQGKEGGHRWVEIKIDNKRIILADGTVSKGNVPDIELSKMGDETKMFFVTSNEFSGTEPFEYFIDNPNVSNFKNIDKKIGYIKSDYFSEIMKNPLNEKLRKLGQENGYLIDIDSKSLMDYKFPDNFDGYDAYNFYKTISRIKKGKLNISNFELKLNEISPNKYEGVSVLTEGDKVYVYSESLGSLYFDRYSSEYSNFINGLKDIER